MNLQENIQRIRQMMGLINENIDDLLDKMNQKQELSQEEKDKMNAYSQHLQAGGNEFNFEYTEKEKQPDPDYVYVIDGWGRLDLNTPIEQVHKIFDEIYKGMKIAEGTEWWKPWGGSLAKVVGKDEEPEKQLVKWKIVFNTVAGDEQIASPKIGISYNTDTGEKEVWRQGKTLWIPRDKFKIKFDQDYYEEPIKKHFFLYFDQNANRGSSGDAIKFAKNAFESWVEKKFDLPRGEYKFLYFDESQRLFYVLKEIKDNIIGTL